MSLKKSRNELLDFVSDIEDLSIRMPLDNIDEVWKKLIVDINSYNKSKQYGYFYEDVTGSKFSIEQSERPDIIYQCDDFIMGIECLTFDASKKTKSGSKQMQKEAEAKRAINEEFRNSTETEGGILSIKRTVDVELSIADYCESLADNYLKHANKIEDYRKKLKEKSNGKKVLLSFFIEDITALGNYVVGNGKTESLNPLKLPFFLDILAATSGLDYVLIKTTDMYVPSFCIQKVSIPLLKKLLYDCYTSDYKYLQYNYNLQSDFLG